MRFFQKHFNKHHLLRAPHKWFLAFLVSPIHFLEVHYKKKYHLHFIHARKLFLFDMALLTSVFVIGAATLFWFTYNPTVVDLVHVSIAASTHSADPLVSIQSGDHITFTVQYINNSDTVLLNPILSFVLPEGFVVEEVLDERYQDSTHSFTLDDLEPKQSDTLSISGLFYGATNKEEHIVALFSYRQTERNVREEKRATFLTTLRGSTLNTTIEAPKKMIAQGSVPIKITIENTNHHAVENISVPLRQAGFFIKPREKTEIIDAITNGYWIIDRLEPQEVRVLEAMLVADISLVQESIDLSFSPVITLNNQGFSQFPAVQSIDILHPKLFVETFWENSEKNAEPKSIQTLNVTIRNNGSGDFSNISISLPTPSSIVDTTIFKQKNNGILKNEEFTTNKNFFANLAELKSGEFTSVSIAIPIRYKPQGATDLFLTLNTMAKANIATIPDAKIEASAKSTPLAIGTQLLLNSEARYYTNEGDQLGRGPLPPRVGKETKYWAFIDLENTTSKLTSVQFSATLPKHVVWTGKTSVSRGQDVVYTKETRKISWSLPALLPHAEAGIYMELSFTADPGQLGSTPTLLQDIQVSAYDTFIGVPIVRRVGDIDVSLANDEKAQGRGVIVQ